MDAEVTVGEEQPDAQLDHRRPRCDPPRGGPHRINGRGGADSVAAARSIDRRRRSAWCCAAVARAKDGDDDALRFLYLRYADNVYGYVCSIVHDEHEAEDVTQHIFAKLMTALDRYEPRVMPFSSWILRVAHNAAIDHVRARRPTPSRRSARSRSRSTSRVASASPTCAWRSTRCRPSSAT